MSQNFELDDINTSGMGRYAHVPASISRRFNVGAFCLNFFWLLYYRQHFLAILYFICFALFAIPQLRILMLIFYFGLGLAVGRFGNMWAWRSSRYKSVSDFQSVHKRIAIFGVIFQIIFLFLALRVAPVDTRMLMMFEYPDMYYFQKYWNEGASPPQNQNPVRQIEDVYSNAKLQEYKTKFIKSVSELNSAFSLYWALKDSNVNNVQGSDLADMAQEYIKNTAYKNNNILKTTEGVIYQFESNGGDCSQDGCYVLIDVNGVESGPNKYWEGGKQISDRLRAKIKRGEKGVFYVETPSYLMNN